MLLCCYEAVRRIFCFLVFVLFFNGHCDVWLGTFVTSNVLCIIKNCFFLQKHLNGNALITSHGLARWNNNNANKPVLTKKVMSMIGSIFQNTQSYHICCTCPVYSNGNFTFLFLHFCTVMTNNNLTFRLIWCEL